MKSKRLLFIFHELFLLIDVEILILKGDHSKSLFEMSKCCFRFEFYFSVPLGANYSHTKDFCKTQKRFIWKPNRQYECFRLIYFLIVERGLVIQASVSFKFNWSLVSVIFSNCHWNQVHLPFPFRHYLSSWLAEQRLMRYT